MNSVRRKQQRLSEFRLFKHKVKFIIGRDLPKMRGNKNEDSFNPTFRNTRSRLYQRKPSAEYQDHSQSKQPHPQHSGSHWKQQGNQAFRIQDYDKAIQCYSKAIELNPGESQYYSNRSKCYQKKGQLKESLRDAEVACELDEDNIKAHYICGCILAELGKNDDGKLPKAMNRLKKALRLCRTKVAREFEEDISIKMFRLKKLIWFKEREKQREDVQLQLHLIQKSVQQKDSNYQRLIERLKEQKRALEEPRQIPDHLICKITLALMEEPVVSQEGFSYQKKELEEYYKTKGTIQPITRKKVQGKLYPNHALKQAIDQFLRINPWAFEEDGNENYHSIPFI